MKYKAFLFSILLPPSLEAATYYISNSGLDSNLGTSIVAPFQTIAKRYYPSPSR